MTLTRHLFNILRSYAAFIPISQAREFIALQSHIGGGLTHVIHAGGTVVFVLLTTLAILLVGNQQRAYADLPPPDLGTDIVCDVFTTLTELGDPIPILTTDDCSSEGETPAPPAPPSPPESRPACSDGRDNDRDGLVDENDPGCSGPEDSDETNPEPPPEGEAKLVVVKVVVNDDGGTSTVSDFSLHVATTSPGNAEAIGVSSGATTSVSAGTWTVGEAQKPGYLASFSGDCNADGQVTLAPGETKTCIITNDDVLRIEGGGTNEEDTSEAPTGGSGGSGAPPTAGGGGGGGSIGGGGLPPGTTLFSSTGTSTGATGGSPAGIVFGLSTTTESCDRYLTAFIREGQDNDVDQVKRLQRFLRDHESADVAETGFYDAATLAAVHAFQRTYASDILTPWGIGESTGYVYLTTRKKVNEIFCEYAKTFPLTLGELEKIQTVRTAASRVPPPPAPPALSPRSPENSSIEPADAANFNESANGSGGVSQVNTGESSSGLREAIDFIRDLLSRTLRR